MRKVDQIHIIKHQRRMLLKSGNKVIRTYSISLGKQPTGKKQFEGDEKTPEGDYIIYHKSEQSTFYKSMGISYPGDAEKLNAENTGKSPGGQIRIHGFSNDFEGDQDEGKKTDWTAGCIAVTNAEMDEIFELVDIGTAIFIEP